LHEGLPAPTDAGRRFEPDLNDEPPAGGEVIRSWRCRMGITQEELARTLGVTLSTVNRWENGHVLPSRLAWRGLKGFATKRGCPILVP